MSQALADGFRWYLAIVGCNARKRITRGVGSDLRVQRMVHHFPPTPYPIRHNLRGAYLLQGLIPA